MVSSIMQIPKVNGMLETAIYVADLERAEQWYRNTFGFEVMLRDERICALNVGPAQALLLFKEQSTTEGVQMPGGFIPAHDAQGQIHFAFAIAEESYDAWRDYLKACDIVIEGEVKAPRGGRSLYFRDPDGHLVELATPSLWPNY